MSLPAAGPPTVSQTCPRCHEKRTVPEGDRIPPCSCADLPPSERNTVDVYERVSDTPGSRFFAISFPMGERPVTAYADSYTAVEAKVKHSLDVGWKP